MHAHASKWLSCVEGKAGVPYATLVGVLFLSLAMVGWICCSACDDHDDEDEEEIEPKKQTVSGLRKIKTYIYKNLTGRCKFTFTMICEDKH